MQERGYQVQVQVQVPATQRTRGIRNVLVAQRVLAEKIENITFFLL